MKNAILKIKALFANAPNKAPQTTDVLLLSLFTALITFQPYYLHRVVDYFELAIYLPGINALMNGLIPYRDFFHLRGPLELYVPAFFMNLFGKNIAVLCTYFYVGTIATLIIWVAIGKQLFKTRLILYLFTLILIARTFPRVVFQIWGGMRFALGALAVLFIIKYLKTKKHFWMLMAGITTSLGLLTSVEIGIFALFSVMATAAVLLAFGFYRFKEVLKAALWFSAGMLFILIPYGIYLMATESLGPFIDSFLSVTQNMPQVFPDHLFEDHPRTVLEALLGLNPGNKHFKHLTPAYCYIFFALFLLIKLRQKDISEESLHVLPVCFYGFIMYVFAFRKIGAAQFEMALQPEKILLFFMLERAYSLLILSKNKFRMLKESTSIKKLKKPLMLKITGINILLFLFLGSSIGYPIQRFNHRFIAFQYLRNWLAGQGTESLNPDETLVKANVPAAQGLYIPSWQKEDFEGLNQFVTQHMQKQDKLFTFPELGIYNFIVDRPFVGKFPVVIFSWFNRRWEEELFTALKKEKPLYVAMPKELDPVFNKVYFKVPANKSSYEKFSRYIHAHYAQAASTPSLLILKRTP